ncbi:YdcF family protein [Bradyrhizobium brasilense]|uniref:YdcF family protein n=1 Tax=Bradyrhizobium brasilense TaxID=1419277 RepID=UPI0024B1D86D|nr:YdcF family protein [Bradyrhizobium australafricanum]WFU36672.1 YdcF family protein [Bradyrhizobium australafricanum]
MFFVLSKTLGIMLLPINFLIGIGVIGTVLLLTRFARLGRRLMVAALLLLAICGFSPLGNVLISTLEQRFPPWDASRGVPDGIIVLGGSIDADLSVAHGTPVVRSAADRVIAAAALARRYPNARLVFTGGSANLISNDAREADYAAEMFEGLGIARSRLIIERRSRNTVENAEFSRALVDPKPGERWLLVTSAYHMPRSVGLFRKAGFNVEAYPVDWRVGNVFSFGTLAIEGLSRTDLGTREWIGLLAYHLAGRTDDLLPGPAAR